MSASRSSRSSSRSARGASKKSAPAITAAHAPWIKHGIDYGPACAALGDLATWALDLAERSVVDWPAGRGHVRATRRFVESRLSGNRPHDASIDDVMFTARLLARIFDEDLGLGLSEVLTIFDALELPIEVVPIPSYTPRAPRSMPSTRRALIQTTHRTRPVAPPLLRLCDDCGYVHEPGDHVRRRNAA